MLIKDWLLRRASLALRPRRRRQMPSSACCSNCYTKYSILNPEEGCSNCAFSFCRKCLPHRAIIPKYANKPVTVCARCFEKLNAKTLENQEKDGTMITRIPIADPPKAPHSGAASTSSTNWGVLAYSTILQDVLPCTLPVHIPKTPLNGPALTEIEERLAALRGCDVELIRRPRCMFESAEKPRPSAGTAEQLMKEAKDLAEIEERHDVGNELERRFKRLKYEDEPPPNENPDGAETNELTPGAANEPRMSTVSSATAFSEATANELEEIKRLMEDAEKRVKATEADDKLVQQEMRSVLAATRQKSLEVEKVNREIGKFWDKQLDKVEFSESDEDDIDDETVKKIILEAENATPDVPEDPPEKVAVTPTTAQSSSPKKAGFFSKFFRR
ncbi:hypothetical protein COOONC_11645 [Cooperia oncophora]